MDRDRSWLAPLTGVLFVVLVIAGFALAGEPPDVDEGSAEEVAAYYAENDGQVIAGAAVQGVAATLFVFFGGLLRRALRDAEGPAGALSAVAFAGTIIFATGIAIDGTISFALAETAEDIDPTGTQALLALWENDFLPFAVGLQVFLLATGISIIRHRALPAWIGWIAVVLALAAVTPAGFAAFIGGGILVLILSVTMTMRARAGTPAGGPPPAAAA